MSATARWMGKVQPTRASSSLHRVPFWKQALAFVFGFCIQFNVLVGGGGGGAAATGGYGFRIMDFLSVLAIMLLGLHVMVGPRLLSLTIFCMMVGLLILIRILEPTIWSDPYTINLAAHYLAYLFAGLYLAVLLAEKQALDKFCWGLVLGLLATVPIFAIQDAGYSSSLVGLGLVPGYYQILSLTVGDTSRYAGLWGHPNEAGHVAAIAAAAGAYFISVRRYAPVVLVTGGLITVFYYTQCRGGILAGGAVMVLAFLLGRGRQTNLARFPVAAAVVAITIALISQLEFVTWRFEEDPSTANNFAERLSTITSGVQVALSHPFGLPYREFSEIMTAATGGVASPHNGFLLFIGIFGLLPFLVLTVAFLVNLRIRTDIDRFFAFATLQVTFSFMFEQLPESYPFAFMICLILGRAYLKTPICSYLITPVAARVYDERLGANTSYLRVDTQRPL
jgi:hypothetical protein